MKKLLSLFIFILSFNAYSQVTEHKCDFLWQTLADHAEVKGRSIIKTLNQKINDEMTADVTIGEKSSTIVVTEYYKESRQNYIEHKFSCDRVYNCEASRTNMIDGKIEIEKVKMQKSSTEAIGKIGTRDVFSYQNLPDGMVYDYIVYRNDKNEPMGLKVSCRK